MGKATKIKKYGFVYIWRDRKYNRYYIGCRWGTVDDGYICSSSWMNTSISHRPNDFKRKILKTNINDKKQLLEEEYYWLKMIKKEEMKPLNQNPKYYNLHNHHFNHWSFEENYNLKISEKVSHRKKEEINKRLEQGLPASNCDQEARGKSISNSKKGIALTEEHKAALAKPKAKYSEERKEAKKNELKEQWADGRRNREKGPMKDDHKAAISAAMKGKPKG